MVFFSILPTQSVRELEFEARRRNRLLRSIPRKAKYLGLTVHEAT